MPWLKLKHSSKYCLCCRCQLLLLFRIYDSKYKHPQEVPIACRDKNFKLRACVVPTSSELLVPSGWGMCPWGWGKRWIYWQGCRWSRSQLPPYAGLLGIGESGRRMVLARWGLFGSQKTNGKDQQWPKCQTEAAEFFLTRVTQSKTDLSAVVHVSTFEYLLI
jgi:hypothetical protein